MPQKIIQLILLLLLPIFIQLNALTMVSKSGNIVFTLIMFGAILYVLIRIARKYDLPAPSSQLSSRKLKIFTVISFHINY